MTSEIASGHCQSFRYDPIAFYLCNLLVITPTRARSRWLTERTASSSSGSRTSDSCNENAGSCLLAKIVRKAAVKTVLKKSDR